VTDPVLTGEVVGYRQWRVTPDLELRAAAHRGRDVWSLGENAAVCRRMCDPVSGSIFSTLVGPIAAPCDDTPGPDCECGFYGLHSPNDLWYGSSALSTLSGLFTFSTGLDDPDPLVSGVIVAWGKMQVHHQGFRAEFARVAALAIPESKRDAAVARAVAAAYDVPCVPAKALPKIGDEFGSTVPEGLRPPAPERNPDDLIFHIPSGLLQFYPVGPQPQSSFRWTAPPVLPAPKVHVPATWNPAWQDALDEAIEMAKPGDGKVSEAIARRPAANRQGPARPMRAPKRLGPR
jgi:hypothetical protein